MPNPNALTLLTLKSNDVRNHVHPALICAEVVIYGFFSALGLTAVVTSAKDGNHSKLSRHFQMPGDARPAQAIDVRIWGIHDAPTLFFRLATALNKANAWMVAHDEIVEGEYIILLEKDHAHIEWNPKGVAPNLATYSPGRIFYIAGQSSETNP